MPKKKGSKVAAQKFSVALNKPRVLTKSSDKGKPPQTSKIMDAVEIFNLAKVTDGFDNFIAKLGLNNANVLSAGYYTFNLLTKNRIQLEAAYRGSWVVGKMIDCVAEDMTREGIEITTNEGKDDVKKFYSKMTELQINKSNCSNIKWSRLYGGSIGVTQIRGQDFATPLRLDSIGKDQFDGIVVFDRWQLNPDLTNVIRSGPDMGLPEYYYIVNNPAQISQESGTVDYSGQIKVHHSRVIRMGGIELPFYQAITEMMWGESVLERIWDRLIPFDSATMSSANLIERANNRTISVKGLREIIAAGGEEVETLMKMFDMIREFQTNESMTILDSEDTFATSNYSFAGLDNLLLQFGQQLSGACDIPLVRLFGQSPAGLNSTGESDLRMYYDTIKAQQEAQLRRPYRLIIEIMWRSIFGKPVPEDLEFEFVSLWQMSALDKATIAKTTTETIIGAHEDGLVTTAQAMEELRDSAPETGVFANISDESIAEAEEEPPLPSPEEAAATSADPQEPQKIKKPIPSLDSFPVRLKNLFRRKSS